jgi:hypothetical protein
VVVVSSLFFVYSYVNMKTQTNESLAKFAYDHLLFTFLFVFVSPVERCSLENFSDPWRAIAMDLQTFENNKENFW